MGESVVTLISDDPAVVKLVTASVDPGFVVVPSSALEQAGGTPRIILLEIADGLAGKGQIERLRERFPGTPIVSLGPEKAAYATEDHIRGSQLDGDRIRRVIRTVVDRTDVLDELNWRTAQLADSEERFRSLVSNSSDVIGVLERDGAFRYASPSVERVLGYPPKGMNGKSLVEMTHHQDAPGVASYLAAVRATPGQPLTHSFRVRDSGGGWIHAEVVAVNQLDDALVEGIVINMRDVTHSRQRERELLKRETELRLLVDQLPAIVWTTDRELRITSTRGRGLTLVGSPANRTKGMTIYEMFGATDASNSAVRVHLEALQGLSAEVKALPWQDRLLNAYVEPLRSEVGEIIGTIGLSVDVTEQSLVHDRLRRSEEQYRSMVEMMSEGLVETDENQIAVFVNRRTCELLGYSREALLGRSARECLGVPEEREMIKTELADRRPGLPERNEVRTFNSRGDRLDLLVSSAPRLDDNGQYRGSVTLLSDITERRQAEDEIRQREQRLEMQFAVTKTLGESTDVSSAMDQVLMAIANSLGCTAGLFWRTAQRGTVLQPISSWSTPAHRPFVEAICRLTLKKGEGLPGAVWATHQSAWIADLADDPNFLEKEAAAECGIASGFALPIGAGGGFCGVLEILGPSPVPMDGELEAVIEDIARQIGLFIARVSSQAEIRLSRERLAEAQRIARIGSWEWDLASDRVDVSNELLNLFGIGATEFKGTVESFLSLFGTEDRAIRTALDRARLFHERFEQNFTLRLRENRTRSFQARGSVVLDDGSVPRMIGTVQDVTEQSLLKHAVDRAQRLGSLGRMAGSIAHEFNNTLMGISPAAELLARRAADPAATDAARRILQSVKRGKRITGEILRFAQPSEPDVESIEVAAWLETVARELRQIVGAAVQIQVIPPPVPLFIAGDVQQLNQVLINLGLNSADAMPSGGHFFLAATSTQSDDADQFGLTQYHRYIHLEVRDTGSGIDADTVAQIFEPLFTTKKSGTGLGLAVVQQIMSRHGGHVFVTSEPGLGTTFHLFLPAAMQSERSESMEPGEPAKVAHKKLLLVEDDENVAVGISEILRMEGFEVEVLGEGKAVMDAIGRFRPDAVVLDVGLPDIPGTEILLRIQQSYPDLPVVLSTGHADPGLIAKADGHRIGFLHKPYDMTTLLRILADVMD